MRKVYFYALVLIPALALNAPALDLDTIPNGCAWPCGKEVLVYDWEGKLESAQSSNLTITTSFSGDVSGVYTNLQLGTGVVTATEILDYTIATADISTGGVATANILDYTIASADISTGGVASVNILDETIVAADIATGAVTGVEILDYTIATADISTGGVSSANILDYTIVTADISTGGVASANILDYTIVSADISTGGVATANILDGTIATNDLDTSSVDTRYANLSGDTFTGAVSGTTFTASGNITANGNLLGDGVTIITNIAAVHITGVYNSGGKSGITTNQQFLSATGVTNTLEITGGLITDIL